MNYVAHVCRGTRDGSCNNIWVDEDITNTTTIPPSWKYCEECCKKLGIDFKKQKPSDYRTDEQNEKLKNKMKKAREKMKLNIKSE